MTNRCTACGIILRHEEVECLNVKICESCSDVFIRLGYIQLPSSGFITPVLIPSSDGSAFCLYAIPESLIDDLLDMSFNYCERIEYLKSNAVNEPLKRTIKRFDGIGIKLAEIDATGY